MHKSITPAQLSRYPVSSQTYLTTVEIEEGGTGVSGAEGKWGWEMHLINNNGAFSQVSCFMTK